VAENYKEGQVLFTMARTMSVNVAQVPTDNKSIQLLKPKNSSQIFYFAIALSSGGQLGIISQKISFSIKVKVPIIDRRTTKIVIFFKQLRWTIALHTHETYQD